MISRSGRLICSTLIAIVLAGTASRAQDADPTAPVARPPAAESSAPKSDAAPRQPAKPHLQATPKAPPTPAAAPASATAPPATLPNGASSITEIYGDWTVICRIDGGQKICALSQAQGNKQTGQRSFAIELLTPRNGKTDGTILMPFGLKLDAGALLKLDDKDLGQGVRFSTCVPEGCLLPISLPTVATDAMKKATTLVVAALDLNTGKPATFSVSLNGFFAAAKRATDLAN